MGLCIYDATQRHMHDPCASPSPWACKKTSERTPTTRIASAPIGSLRIDGCPFIYVLALVVIIICYRRRLVVSSSRRQKSSPHLLTQHILSPPPPTSMSAAAVDAPVAMLRIFYYFALPFLGFFGSSLRGNDLSSSHSVCRKSLAACVSK